MRGGERQEQMIRKGYYIKTIRQLYVPGTEKYLLQLKITHYPSVGEFGLLIESAMAIKCEM